MYKTEITVNDKVIPIRFGAYVLKCLADTGIKLSELSDSIADNPADIIPQIMYFGAVNASKDRGGEGISINDIYDWLDEQPGGLFGAAAMDILNLFTRQMSDGVPQDKSKGIAKKK